MDRNIRIGWLLDFYGPLLTQKQRRVLELRWNDDLSLAEIGESMDMSRQAVNDAAARGEDRLNLLEDTLGLLRRHEAVGRELAGCLEVAERLAAARLSVDADELLERIRRTIRVWEE